MASYTVLVCVTFIFVFFHDTNAQDSNTSPLILTPYLDSSDPSTARSLSKVMPDIGGVSSYSGFFTVNKSCGNNLFFWYFPAVTDWKDQPVVLWLQGGPGSSSMFGLFELVGPFNSFSSGLKARNYSWSNFSNLLFIDNPVGAGFSFSTGGCYATSLSEVVEGLYSALIQFFKLFPELKHNKLFLAGESFAAHYIPPLGVTNYNMNSNGSSEIINLTGIVIGNPLMNLDCHDYASFLYQVGIADNKLRDDLFKYQRFLKDNVKKGNFTGAFQNWNYIMNDLINNQTQQPSRFNILTEVPDPSNYDIYVATREVREKIHVGNVTYNDINFVAYTNLIPTIAQPCSPYVEILLKTGKYIVGLYSGQLDIICLYPSTVCVLRGLKWPGRKNYLNSTRNIWYIEDKVVGWFKTANNLLLDVLVKDAGHSAPFYKPRETFEMMRSIVNASSGQNPLWNLKTTDE